MADLTSIGAALGSVKTLWEIAKNAQDAQIAMKISAELGNIQGQLIDVQQQTLSIQEENQRLRGEIDRLKSLTHHHSVAWRKKPDGTEDGPFCPVCVGRGRDMRLTLVPRIARDPRHLGAEIGFFSVLHTWNQRLQHHPHINCVLAAGGLAPDHSRWISSRPSFFLPRGVLSRVFRGKFVDGLKTAFREGKIKFHGHLIPLAEPRTFASWLRLLFRHHWVVYAKRPFGGPEHALRYLGAYTHRVAISNHRLVALTDGTITFRWRDSAHGNKKRVMTLTVDEFLRRFLLHLLPRGFVRIRNFGFLANRQRAGRVPRRRECRRVREASAITQDTDIVERRLNSREHIANCGFGLVCRLGPLCGVNVCSLFGVTAKTSCAVRKGTPACRDDRCSSRCRFKQSEAC